MTVAQRSQAESAQAASPPSPSDFARWPLLVYLVAAAIVRSVDQGARIALVLLALNRTGSAALGGGLVAALMVPHVAAAPIAGSLADRARRRRLFHAGALTIFGAALAAAALLVGHAPAPPILLIVAVGGCCGPLLTGGLTGLLRELAPGGALNRVYSMDSVSYNLAGICGPALAALLAGAIGPGPATLALGLGVVGGALLLCVLPLAARGPDDVSDGRLLDYRGIIEVCRNRVLRAVTLASSVGALGVGALPLVAALLARRYQHVSAAGLLVAGFAAGALAGSLAYARMPRGRTEPQHIVIAGLIFAGIPLLCVPLSPNQPATLALFAASGFGTGPLFSALLETRHEQAPPGAHTQVFTFGAGVKTTAAAVGAAVAGAATGLGAPALVLGMAGCQILGAAGGALILRHRPPPTARVRDV